MPVEDLISYRHGEYRQAHFFEGESPISTDGFRKIHTAIANFFLNDKFAYILFPNSLAGLKKTWVIKNAKKCQKVNIGIGFYEKWMV